MEIEIILKMLLAAVLGGIIGLEREITHKEGGLRVTVLVAVGSALMTALFIKLAGGAGTQAAAASPMIGHIISALGLIGAGIIIKEQFALHGITTAAIVWSTGAIGMIVGTGYYLTAFAAALFIVIGVLLLNRIASALEKHSNIYVYVITTEERASIIIEIKKIIVELGMQYISAHLKKNRGGCEIEIAVSTSQNKNKAFIERVMQIPDVKEITSENL